MTFEPDSPGDGPGRDDLHSDEGVVLAFVAPWCGPCQRLEPILDEVATSHMSTVRLEKVRVDQHPDLVERYGVRATPTVLVRCGDQELARSVGAVSRIELDRLFAIAGSAEATSGGGRLVRNRVDVALRLGAGVSLVTAGVMLGSHPAVLVVGMLVAVSAVLTRRTVRPSQPPDPGEAGSTQ